MNTGIVNTVGTDGRCSLCGIQITPGMSVHMCGPFPVPNYSQPEMSSPFVMPATSGFINVFPDPRIAELEAQLKAAEDKINSLQEINALLRETIALRSKLRTLEGR